MVTHNFDAVRGDTFRKKITITKNGAPVDITGWKIYFSLKRNKYDTNTVLQKEIVEHTSPTTGESLLLLLPAETSNLSGSYYYDLQIKRLITEPLIYDDIETPLEGVINFTEDITR